MLTRMRRKGNLCALFVGMKIGTALWKTICFLKKKNKNRTTILSSSSISGFLSEENKNTTLKRYMHPNVHCNITDNRQDMEET